NHQACGDEDDRSQCRDVVGRQRPRVLGLAQSLHENDGAEAEQEPTQQPRHVAGTHAQGGANGIIAREPQAERRHRDEEQAGQHTLAAAPAPERMGQVFLSLPEAQTAAPIPIVMRAQAASSKHRIFRAAKSRHTVFRWLLAHPLSRMMTLGSSDMVTLRSAERYAPGMTGSSR